RSVRSNSRVLLDLSQDVTSAKGTRTHFVRRKVLDYMIETLLQTNADYVSTFLRIIAGITIFPYGMQKLFRWFDGWGIERTLEQLTLKKIPKFVAWLIIVGQSFGSIALVAGFLGRIAAGGLFIIFTGALIVHLPDGWAMNWFGEKKGEGIEYHVMLLSLLLIVIVRGSGAMSIDLWLTS
ncbi:MAG TPA: DoxX family protein, partial [Chthoniobacterales bacterium]|nr:DoxX family protein [Chthoniobacterales bacterium]